MPRAVKPFTVDHFRAFNDLLVFDDGEHHELGDWQIDWIRDLFNPLFREGWLIVPEGNSKTTLVAELALYGGHFAPRPWIPIGASARDQAMITYRQCQMFVDATPGFKSHFDCHEGLKVIRTRMGGEGIKVYPWDPKTGDGVIVFPWAIIDEPHRHPNMRLYRLWKGKLRKRGAKIIAISTAGEPNTEFEDTRDQVRDLGTQRRRRGGRLRVAGRGIVMHEYMLKNERDYSDMAKVKAVNPLCTITEETLREDFESPTMDVGDWKRFKCDIPARSAAAAITDSEWMDAQVDVDQWPEGEHVDVGADVAWKHDTFAIVPEFNGPDYHLLGPATILTPPRDGTSMHPDQVKVAFEAIHERNPIDAAVIDMERAEDIAAWLEDEMGITVIDRGQSNVLHAEDYEAFMAGLRNGTLKHTGDPGLRRQVMNAIARLLPGGRRRFDRPSSSRASSKQDVRVVDALTASGMVHQYQAGQQVVLEPLMEWG